MRAMSLSVVSQARTIGLSEIGGIATTAAIAQEAARRQCKRLVNVLESFPVTLKRVAEQMSGIFKREHSAVGVVPDIVTLPEGQEESVGGSPFARVQQRARRQGSRPPGD